MTTETPAPTALQRTGVDPAIGAAIEVYERLNVIRNVLAPDLNDQELQLFAIVAQRSRLDPFAKQIYAIKRKGRVTFQTGIDGFRSSAEETDEYRGSDEPEFGPMVDKPFVHPEWSRVVVHRQFANGEWLHQPATVYFDEFYPGDGEASFNWRKMPRNQLAKCAEAAAFRKAFPKRFADVYTAEEMQVVDAAEAARPVAPTARERVAARRAELEAQTNPTTDATSKASEAGELTAGTRTEQPIPEPATSCQVASPRGEACLVEGAHTAHRNGRKAWPDPVDVVEQAQQVFAGEIKSVGPDLTPRPDVDLQAGLDLIPEKKGGQHL